MDASCKIQRSIHMFHLVHQYVSRILGTYQNEGGVLFWGTKFMTLGSNNLFSLWSIEKDKQLKNIRQYLGIEKEGRRETKQHRKQRERQ
jgi:hypothetical protein